MGSNRIDFGFSRRGFTSCIDGFLSVVAIIVFSAQLCLLLLVLAFVIEAED
jgi:hypothetical protein